MKAEEKQEIERSIERARDGVSDRIDELDRRLRTSFDFKAKAAEHAPELIAGGALIGLLVGFGFPKVFKLALKIGIPVALVAYAVKLRNGAGEDVDLGLS